MSRKSAKFKKAFAVIVGEMYPVGLCLHILPDVLWYDYCGFLAEPSRQCLGAFGFFTPQGVLDFATQVAGLGVFFLLLRRFHAFSMS